MDYLQLEVSERWGLDSTDAYAALEQKYRKLAEARDRRNAFIGTFMTVLWAILGLLAVTGVVFNILLAAFVWYFIAPIVMVVLCSVAYLHMYAAKNYYERRCSLWRANEIGNYLKNRAGVSGVASNTTSKRTA